MYFVFIFIVSMFYEFTLALVAAIISKKMTKSIYLIIFNHSTNKSIQINVK